MEDHPMHTFHSTTTPAWNMSDKIVKEEPNEDKINDSGIPPSDCLDKSCSPVSKCSSATRNLLPDSPTSQDSTSALPVDNFDYNPSQNIYNKQSSSLPLLYPRIGVDKPTVQENKHFESDHLHCPVCIFTSSDRVKFHEHLEIHYENNTRPNDPQLSPNMDIPDECRPSTSRGLASDSKQSNATEEPGISTPRVNSTRKVKILSCKHCAFQAITKHELWEHIEGHIESSRLLRCTVCPFRTEYKHHLQYHMRNHTGSKPYVCEKCDYACVNKSMLNSHMKSHSSVYQYSCSDCSYATKYCHSLKLHLRKYGHQPGVVRNPDGTVNPYPIIDVYGTHRGPKQMPNKKKNSGGAAAAAASGAYSTSALYAAGQMNPGTPSSVPEPPMSPINCHPAINPMGVFNTLRNNMNLMMAFLFSQHDNPTLAVPNHFGIPLNFNEQQFEQIKANIFAEYVKVLSGESGCMNFANSPQNIHESFNIPSNPQMALKIEEVERQSPILEENRADLPLDLSKPDTSAVNNNNNDTVQDQHQRYGSPQQFIAQNQQTSFPVTSTPYEFIAQNQQTSVTITPLSKASRTGRRKRKAVKLDCQIVGCESDNENVVVGNSGSRKIRILGNLLPSSSLTQDDDKNRVTPFKAASNSFTCQFCQISFGNEVMHTVHMGYHGFKDPFTCNMCGHECSDHVSFFLHIARVEHA